MDYFRQIDLQSLIDLLARETEKYTKACIANVPNMIAYHKTIVDALIVEITSRK